VSGTTLIEITVVLAILLLIAAAVAPRVVAMQRSQNLKQLEGKIARLPADAAAQAVALQTPVRIRASSDSLIMEKVSLDADGAISDASPSDQIKEIDLGDVDVDNAQLNGQPAQPGGWEWIVYPDGSSDTGALEFDVDKSHYSLVITDHAACTWIQGDMPDETQDTWPVGVMVQRT
jgi:Tfp pilus assembly protein FimT